MNYVVLDAQENELGVYDTFIGALEKVAELMGKDIEPDWICEIGWGYFADDGKEYGIFCKD